MSALHLRYGSLEDEHQANLVNCVQFKISSYISCRIHNTNYLFPTWYHEDRRLNFFRQQSKYITLSEARMILERVAGRTYAINAVTNRVSKNKLGSKSGGKMSQWLVDKEAFETFVYLERGGR